MEPILTTAEFARAVRTIHDRFDGMDSRIDGCVAEIASVKAIVNERTPKEKKETRNSASGWSAAVASGIVIAVEAIKLALSK